MKDKKQIIVQKEIIPSIVAAHQKTIISTSQFFISWNGVPVLAYTGFSPVLQDIKTQIASRLPGLPMENPGSRWPKTTLGALRDNKTLTKDDLTVLKAICRTFTPQLCHQHLEIDNLSIVLYYWTSLEKRLSTEVIPLSEPRDLSLPAKDDQDKVTDILNQFSGENIDNYLPKVQMQSHRESYYRTPSIGASLVCDVEKFHDIIMRFKYDVDRQLPDTFCWFNTNSLHMTIRVLV